jgi:hypothetical protein
MNKKSNGFVNGRRLFLKAAGVSIALPCLESLAAPASKDVGEPMRMVCISSALGMHPGAFFPKSFGANYELSPTLSPLSKMRDQFTVFSHMDHPGISSKHGAFEGGDAETDGGKLVLTGLPKESRRGGILGHASVLTLTSNGVETSPVTRGVWVLAHFMGTPPHRRPKKFPLSFPTSTVRRRCDKCSRNIAVMPPA